MSLELTGLAKALSLGRPIALAPYLLSQLYRSLMVITCEGFEKGYGPLRLFQLWLMAYLPLVRDDPVRKIADTGYGMEYVRAPLKALSAEPFFRIYYGLALTLSISPRPQEIHQNGLLLLLLVI